MYEYVGIAGDGPAIVMSTHTDAIADFREETIKQKKKKFDAEQASKRNG